MLAAGHPQADLLLLAQELRKIDEGASQTWIASGNLFSLRGDHTTALRHFEHAITANDRAFYARTLAGYEHAQCGDEERAVACFRQAVAQNPRHFTAWAGLVRRSSSWLLWFSLRARAVLDIQHCARAAPRLQKFAALRRVLRVARPRSSARSRCPAFSVAARRGCPSCASRRSQRRWTASARPLS